MSFKELFMIQFHQERSNTDKDELDLIIKIIIIGDSKISD